MAEKNKTSSSGGSKTAAKTSGGTKTEKASRPQYDETQTVQSAVEENSLEDIEVAMRDNPGLRSPDTTRRNLPPEEFPSGSPVRKDEERARKAVDKAIKALEDAAEDVSHDQVRAGKVRTALRTLKTQ